MGLNIFYQFLAHVFNLYCLHIAHSFHFTDSHLIYPPPTQTLGNAARVQPHERLRCRSMFALNQFPCCAGPVADKSYASCANSVHTCEYPVDTVIYAVLPICCPSDELHCICMYLSACLLAFVSACLLSLSLQVRISSETHCQQEFMDCQAHLAPG